MTNLSPLRLLALGLLGACSSSDPIAGSDMLAPTPTASLLASFDLPRRPETQALSGTYFDLATATLYAISDVQPTVVPFTANADYTSFSVGTPIALTGRPESAWDGEGLARSADGTWLAVTVETGPIVERFSTTGAYLGGMDIPARYASQPAGNMGVESLSVSPSGTYLFFCNEGALLTDGDIATKAAGTRLRIHRRNLVSGQEEEHAYLTETVGAGEGGTLGVSDVTAYDDTHLLVLERGYQIGFGNTVRIYRVDVTTGPDVVNVDALDASTTHVTKTLLLDLATLPSVGITNPSTQPNPILDNYEGLALGPQLADGRRVVFVTSDDNQSPTEVARILALALPL